MRRRRSASALIALSVAGSIVVLGSLLGVGVVTEDLATRRALADLAPPDRLIGINRYTLDGFDDAEAERVANAALQPILDVTEPIVAVRMYQPPREPFRILAMEGAADWVEITQGRLPAPCDGTSPCEAIRIGPSALPEGTGEVGTFVELEGLRFNVVGVGVPSPNLPLAVIRPDGLALLVEGRTGIRESPELLTVPRTGFWLAPIDPERVHSWTLMDLGTRVDEIQRLLAPAGQTYQLGTPESTIATVHARTAVATGRLVFISSLIVGVLLAFAAFAAAIERSDVALEDRRLRAAGASRAARLQFVLGEALLPAVAGAIVGELAAALAVAWLASSQAAPVDVVLGLALLQPAGIALTLLLVGLAMVAIVLGIHPAAGRLMQPRVVIAAVLPAGLILAWDRLSGGGAADPSKLAADATSPGSVLLPGALGLSVILGSLVLLPPLLRALARVTRRAPIGIRLAAISVAREPLRPAAIMTLLAFSVAAVVFGQVYSATVRQGAADQAAFTAGLDVRVQTLAAEGRFATYVLPLLQDGAVGTDVEVRPMVRAPGESATGRTFVVAGIDALTIGGLKGWRPDFSPTDPAGLGASLHLDGDWRMAGQALADGVREVAFDVQYTGDPIRLAVIVEQADGAVRYVPATSELAPGRQTMTAPLFDEQELATLPADGPKGWRVLGLLAANGGPAAGGGPEQGHRQEGDATISGLTDIIDPGTPVHLVVSGAASQVVRPRARTDGLVLPAIVAPDLATDVDASGILAVRIGTSLDLQLRPVGTINQFPTITDPGRVVVVDLAPLLLAMNAHDPGTGLPNQVLLGTPSDARTTEVVTALAQDPFPPLVVRSRPAIEDARANDPFAIGLVWGLAIGAIAGLILSLVGVLLATASELRDERGELWELEAQGTTPQALLSLVVLRTVAMCVVGSATGIVVGVALGWFVASAVGVGGDGAVAVPQLVLVIPWLVVAAIAVGLLAVIAVAVWVQGRRHFARASLGAGVR
ncbi:MAG: ABC transporter permease [Chloroflexota bacterium]